MQTGPDSDALSPSTGEAVAHSSLLFRPSLGPKVALAQAALAANFAMRSAHSEPATSDNGTQPSAAEPADHTQQPSSSPPAAVSSAPTKAQQPRSSFIEQPPPRPGAPAPEPIKASRGTLSVDVSCPSEPAGPAAAPQLSRPNSRSPSKPNSRSASRPGSPRQSKLRGSGEGGGYGAAPGRRRSSSAQQEATKAHLTKHMTTPREPCCLGSAAQLAGLQSLVETVSTQWLGNAWAQGPVSCLPAPTLVFRTCGCCRWHPPSQHFHLD